MYKILFTALFLLLFSSIFVYAQEPKSIQLDESTAIETTVIAKEVRLKKIVFEMANDGSFENSRITIVGMIGIPSETTDKETKFSLFTSFGEQEIYSGTLKGYKQELDLAVQNKAITEEESKAIIKSLIDIYTQSFDSFISTSNILKANGKLELKAKKVSQ